MIECTHEYVHDHMYRIGDSDPQHVYYCSKCRHRVVSISKITPIQKEQADE